MVSGRNLGILSGGCFGRGLCTKLVALSFVYGNVLHHIHLDFLRFPTSNTVVAKVAFYTRLHHVANNTFESKVLYFWRGRMVDSSVLFGKWSGMGVHSLWNSPFGIGFFLSMPKCASEISKPYSRTKFTRESGGARFVHEIGGCVG